ncbi:MAG: hypothetical protein QG650_917 [Patescibacteria group bacterium]|nr:hypothetical protein [Patescibacteria group bacterium]
MSESYSKIPGNRTDVRGIARAFPSFDESSVRAAFDKVIGAKEFPSEGELRLVERAKKYCRVLAKFPAIRRIWVCNSLSMNAADADSDIDLFVETAPGRIWTGRVVTTLFFTLLGVRRHGDKVKGRFCLSFFAAEGADFGKIAIPDDVYLSEWARRLVPVDGFEGFRAPLLDWSSTGGGTNESAATSTLLGAGTERSVPRLRRSSERTRNPSSLARLVESILKRLFLGKTLREYERLGKPWGIVISDDFLKFHPEDRRMEIREEVRKRLSKFDTLTPTTRSEK